jgi:hypothetical protein
MALPWFTAGDGCPRIPCTTATVRGAYNRTGHEESEVESIEVGVVAESPFAHALHTHRVVHFRDVRLLALPI